MDRPTQINIPTFSEVGDKKAAIVVVGRKVGELPAVIFQWSKVILNDDCQIYVGEK